MRVLRIRGADNVNPSLRARENEMRCPISSSHARIKGVNSSLLHRLFYSGPQQMGWCLSTLVRAIYFTEATDSAANLIQKYPHKYTQQYLIWAPHGQSTWHLKLIIANMECRLDNRNIKVIEISNILLYYTVVVEVNSKISMHKRYSICNLLSTDPEKREQK